MHTGSIIDFYDDPNGLVLRTKVGAEQVPSFIKTAQFLEGAHQEQLPDDVYALVMLDRGAKLRKYACVDKGNTALSVIYFLENKDKLPEEAQKTAAANLLTACKWYDFQPPAALMKTSGLLGATLGAVGVKDTISQGIKRHKKVMGMPKVGDLAGSNIMPLSSDTEGEEKAAGLAQPDLPRARDVIKGRGPKLLGEGMNKKQRKKVIDDYFSSPAGKGVIAKNVSRLKQGKGFSMPWGQKFDPVVVRGSSAKTAGAMDPYVDVTGKSAPERFEKVAHQRFALVKEGQSRFPIDTYGDVLEADRWFNDHGESLYPEDRREMCTKLAARADEIGCKVSDYIRKYAGAGYAPDGEVRVAVSTRMQYFQDDSPERDMLNGLMDKYASVSPDVFCEAVRQFDEATGLDYHWDDGVYDPWYTTYGFIKEAEWSFSTHGDKINEEQLKQVANASYPLIKEKFGDEMAASLKKSPVSIFGSLPLDTKRIIMRMANDPQPSPALIMS